MTTYQTDEAPTDYVAEAAEAMTLLIGEPKPAMEIAFWDAKGELVRESVYHTIAEQIVGYIDMIDAVKAGGWCLVMRGNKSQMVTKIKQLLS